MLKTDAVSRCSPPPIRAGITTINSDPAQSDDQPVKVSSPPNLPLRILIADDHQIVREGVKAVLEREGFKVIAQASDGKEAVGRTLELQPDVAVLDLTMPVKNGIEAAQEILAAIAETKIVLLTVHVGDFDVRQALRVGIQGHVLKSRPSEELFQAIYEVCQGKIYLSAEISPEIVREYLGITDLPPIHLHRELHARK